jgi:type IV pilus assembly protein PilF
MNILISKLLKNKPICWPAILQACVIIAIFLLLVGCASNQESSDSWEEGSRRKAAESNTSMGLEYMNRGQDEIALGKLKKAVKDDPSYAPAYTVTAVLYEKIGEIELAGVNYKKAYEADRIDGDTNNNYGVYLCKTNQSDLAMTHFLKAIDDPFYSTPAVALSNGGSCALSNAKYDVADEYLRAALKIDSQFPDALISMAKLNYRQDNMRTALAFLQRYESSSTHNPETLLLAIQIEVASNNSTAAQRYLSLLESSFPESDQVNEARRITGR